jgi:hypothetical protein
MYKIQEQTGVGCPGTFDHFSAKKLRYKLDGETGSQSIINYVPCPRSYWPSVGA